VCHHARTEGRKASALPRERPDVRASDADRERHVEVLREHAAAGRLTTEELSERTERVLAARTHGDLADVVRDLPAVEPPSERGQRLAGRRSDFYAHLRPYLLVNLLLIVIWAATGAGYFWPIWPIAGWGLGLLAHASDAFSGGSRPRRRRTMAGA
jgi:hypothetical protein